MDTVDTDYAFLNRPNAVGVAQVSPTRKRWENIAPIRSSTFCAVSSAQAFALEVESSRCEGT
jgi:hypothetical protein